MANYNIKRTLIFQLRFGSDLYDGLAEIVQREHIQLGHIQAIGATTHAVIAYYDQTTKKYTPKAYPPMEDIPLEFPGGMEIVSLTGNVSVRDGKPFVHAHIVLSDAQGKVFGGHLLQGTKLFACEVFIDKFEGEELVREHNEKTGLYLWKTRNFMKGS